MGLWVDTEEPSEHLLCSPNMAPWLWVSAQPAHPTHTHRHAQATQLRQVRKKASERGAADAAAAVFLNAGIGIGRSV